MGGGHEPMLVEVGERHHIAIGRRWQILLVGQQPLIGQGSHAEKTTTDEALHAVEGDVGMAPRIHYRWGRMDAGSTVVRMRRREISVTDGDSRGCGGKDARYGIRGANPLVL